MDSISGNLGYYVIRPLRAVREYGLHVFFQRLKYWLVGSN
jgi:hypothetical protein